MASETPRTVSRVEHRPTPLVRRSLDLYVVAQALLGLGIVAVLVTTVWLLRVIGGA